VYRTVLGLFAPFAPYITEDQYQRLFRGDGDPVSLHLTAWPSADPEWAGDRSEIDALVTLLDAVRARRVQLGLGHTVHIGELVVDAQDDAARSLLAAIEEPLRSGARAGAVRVGPASGATGVPNLFLDVAP
jgi:valyl-tRNA synthetase